MKNFYMQDKRARKRIPLVGTKKYPVIYLGFGTVIDDSISISQECVTIPIIINPEFYRFYANDNDGGEYLEGIKSVQFGRVYDPSMFWVGDER